MLDHYWLDWEVAGVTFGCFLFKMERNAIENPT